MRVFVLNMVLALIWATLWNGFSLLNLVAGFAFGFAALWFARGFFSYPPDRHYFRAVPECGVLFLYFVKELIKSCILVARDCFSPRPNIHPAIVKMPLDVKSDIEIFLLSNLITLTPGTLTLDVAEDRSFLVIHSIYATDEAALVAELKSGMEHRVRKVFGT